ncbi:MAG: hypothetical protein ICV69_15280 [Thermoleophilaceae bacterium]|nr:hypothetical protein [Thermoleophilaceae bacterium]
MPIAAAIGALLLLKPPAFGVAELTGPSAGAKPITPGAQERATGALGASYSHE